DRVTNVRDDRTLPREGLVCISAGRVIAVVPVSASDVRHSAAGLFGIAGPEGEDGGARGGGHAGIGIGHAVAAADPVQLLRATFGDHAAGALLIATPALGLGGEVAILALAATLSEESAAHLAGRFALA